jgi:hypothetical protein
MAKHGGATYNLSTWETEVAASQVPGQPGPHRETLSQTNQIKLKQDEHKYHLIFLFYLQKRKTLLTHACFSSLCLPFLVIDI